MNIPYLTYRVSAQVMRALNREPELYNRLPDGSHAPSIILLALYLPYPSPIPPLSLLEDTLYAIDTLYLMYQFLSIISTILPTHRHSPKGKFRLFFHRWSSYKRPRKWEKE